MAYLKSPSPVVTGGFFTSGDPGCCIRDVKAAKASCSWVRVQLFIAVSRVHNQKDGIKKEQNEERQWIWTNLVLSSPASFPAHEIEKTILAHSSPRDISNFTYKLVMLKCITRWHCGQIWHAKSHSEECGFVETWREYLRGWALTRALLIDLWSQEQHTTLCITTPATSTIWRCAPPLKVIDKNSFDPWKSCAPVHDWDWPSTFSLTAASPRMSDNETEGLTEQNGTRNHLTDFFFFFFFVE